MSDSYFIGTVSHVHNLWRFSRPMAPSSSRYAAEAISSSTKTEVNKKHSEQVAAMKASENAEEEFMGGNYKEGRPRVGMMVSLDHTIFFHHPRAVKADEWLLSEMQSPWAGEGRGLVLQRIWTKDGTLLASCVQEVRARKGTSVKHQC